LIFALIYRQFRKNTKTSIKVNGIEVEDKYGTGEILRRIHTSQTIIFHNSTQIDRRFRRSGHGYVDNIEGKSKENIESKIKAINKELTKAVQKHKSELQTLMGRLQEKYEVGLSISGLDLSLEQLPYEIYLGEKNYELPLEDWVAVLKIGH
jgi:putative ATP-dependent endonuclease of OLD family